MALEKGLGELERRILEIVLDESYQPVKPRIIAKQLGLEDDQRPEVRRAVKKLVRLGLVDFGQNHLVRKPAQVIPPNPRKVESSEGPEIAEEEQGRGGEYAPMLSPKISRRDRRATSLGSSSEAIDRGAKKGRGETIGVFRRSERGFGFVRLKPASPDAPLPDDIHIPAEHTADAATGDTVRVRLSHKRRGKWDVAGEIVEIIQRRTVRFVGTYFAAGGTAFVQVDGKAFFRPIPVGDPGAKGVEPGDKVVMEMVRFPSASRGGEGVLIEVLGPRGKPGVDTLMIIHEHGLPTEFPEDVLEDARQRAAQFNENALDGRRDLREQTIITIDPVDARDFDDAISLELIEGGHWLLGVHIADVSYFVRRDSPLDYEAYDRATSVYLPDRVIPMLPETISNSLASLQPNRARYTKSVFIEYTADGAFVAAETCNAVIESKRRFTYEEVDDYLNDRESWREKLDEKVHALLGRMHTLAMMLRSRRMLRGALELHMPEVKVQLDREGKVAGAARVEYTESHQIIEEFMLAANVAVAEKMFRLGAPFLRRIHAPPNERKMRMLTEFVEELGLPANDLRDRFELQKLLHEVRDRPESAAVNFAVLRSLQRAVYGPEEEGHFALASDCYCHFTSPIRRYPDLTVHRLLDDLQNQGKPHDTLELLVRVGQHCSDREQRAEEAERELTKLKLLAYYSEKIGEKMLGVITGATEFGLFVQGLETPAEGLVHRDTLPPDEYRYDRRSHSLEGFRAGNRFRLGDKLWVQVQGVDQERRELNFAYLGRGAGEGGRASQIGVLPERSKPRGKRPDARRKSTRGKSSGPGKKGKRKKR